MPKQYSEKQKQEIRDKLFLEANDCLQKYGVKKTTVDELVQRVGIPKGTFYLFYKSKEILLFEVIGHYHEEIENEMVSKVMKLSNPMDVDALSHIITEGILMTKNSCLKTLMVPEEMELLLRKLPEELVKEHLEHDEDLMLKMLTNFKGKNEIDYEALSGSFRAIFFAALYPREIGAEHFEQSLFYMVKGLLLQII